MKQVYVPFIKTTDAELRGYEHLENTVKDQILPLFELTRSRKSKNNPIGEIQRRLDSCMDMVGGRQLILDLTTHESLSNPEIERLLSDDNDFENWCSFIEEIDNPNLIPVVHALGDGDGLEITKQAERLLKTSEYVAFRVSAFENNASDYIDKFPDKSKLILLLDAEFIRVGHSPREVASIEQTINGITSLNTLEACVLAASSFPASVVEPGYGEDAYGYFNIEEVILNKMVSDDLPDHSIVYGDYASIHPVRYEMKGGSWVPRVDVPLEDKLYFHRYRREDGGYAQAAKMAIADQKYASMNSWGDIQIQEAAKGAPPGLSPAFWISCRLNMHITRQVLRLQQEISDL